MKNNTYAVVDLETTGNSSAKGDRIIQIAIVFIKNGEIADEYVRFVNPAKKIPAFIRQLTSISNEDVCNAPYFEEIAQEVLELLQGTIFVAHNTDFDLNFLQNEWTRCGLPKWTGMKIDTVELAKIAYPSAQGYRLQDLADELAISLPSAHRADDDARATAQLFLTGFEKLYTLPYETLALLHKRSFTLKSNIASLIFKALKKVRALNERKDYALFRGIPYKKIPADPSVHFRGFDYPAEDQQKKQLFEKAFPVFEQRSSQFRYMDRVWQALQNHEEIAVEVPTGIGKTVGYLLPAAIHSLQANKPIVISTYTNHLVDEMMNGELVRVQQMLGTKLKAVVLKGKAHYISLGKFEELLRIADESYDETFTIMQILVWLTETATGDLDEINVSGGGQLFVDRIRKRTTVLRSDEQQADYYSRLVQLCKQSNVIITNHAMLLSEMNREEGVLTSAAGYIIDEAHQFVQVARRHHEIVFSYTNWKYVMGQLSSDGDGQLLQKIDAIHRQLETANSGHKEQLQFSYSSFSHLFDEVIQLLTVGNWVHKGKQNGERVQYSLVEVNGEMDRFAQVSKALSNYLQLADAYTKSLHARKNELTKDELARLAEWDYWVQEMTIKAGEWIEIFLDLQSDSNTAWVEVDRRSIPGSLTVFKTPIDSAAIIRQFIGKIKDHQAGIIWTSGTLLLQDYDRFIARQLGIADEIPLIQYEAPPHFYEGAEIYLVEDMPDIQKVSQNDYIEAIADAIISVSLTLNGRLFVLFTSQDMLRKTYDLIVESEQLNDFALYAQGVSSGSRMRLLKAFRQLSRSILFGTNSFWEGVDVPGEALSGVVVVRLPFSSPDEPIFKAKAAQLTGAGKNSFMEYALPEAMMRLRQGFGRLVRASTDKGYFIILDRRIETKSYGKHFLKSLPNVPIQKVTLEHMVNDIENCYNNGDE
ncbi:ATP-dependent DNA helicase DinG [Sporosarcina sp. HYO08]|uniref:ATP-dependent DNA helicase DinG n=1 Tax=Sporosarcina sp. HYO08 TaxID=1759557 RepID=UPI000791391B|nr:ATP-dependent DNA helicase DinG [Sporosarcina sp. HYO08]KXH81994.1 hypothetical protein AU377_07000 [Sporosarcina sp. HYO08]